MVLDKFYKKEKPFVGLGGYGGGIAYLGFTGDKVNSFLRASYINDPKFSSEVALDIDSEGNVYWCYANTQYYDGSNGNQRQQAIVEKFNPSGSLVWQKKFWGNGTLSSTIEDPEFLAIRLNNDDTYLALFAKWRPNTTNLSTIVILDTSNGDILETEYLNSGQDADNLSWTANQNTRLILSAQQGGTGQYMYHYWITGSNKSSSPIKSIARNDNYSKSSPYITGIYPYDPSVTNDYRVFGTFRFNTNNSQYRIGVQSWSQNGTSPQFEYRDENAYCEGYLGTMIAAKYQQSPLVDQYISVNNYRNGVNTREIALMDTSSTIWARRSSGNNSDSIGKIIPAYDTSTNKVWIFAYLPGQYRRYLIAELHETTGAIVQQKMFYVNTKGGSQSNPSAFNDGATYVVRSKFRVDDTHVYFCGYSDGYGANSQVLFKLPKDLSIVSNGTYIVIKDDSGSSSPKQVEVVFETPPTLQWDDVTSGRSGLTSIDVWTSTTPPTGSLTQWTTPTIDLDETTNAITGTKLI